MPQMARGRRSARRKRGFQPLALMQKELEKLFYARPAFNSPRISLPDILLNISSSAASTSRACRAFLLPSSQMPQMVPGRRSAKRKRGFQPLALMQKELEKLFYARSAFNSPRISLPDILLNISSSAASTSRACRAFLLPSSGLPQWVQDAKPG
jgi:hypothetical protein